MVKKKPRNKAHRQLLIDRWFSVPKKNKTLLSSEESNKHDTIVGRRKNTPALRRTKGFFSAKLNPVSYYYFVSSTVIRIPSLCTVACAHRPFARATVWMTRPWLLLPLSPKPKTNTEVPWRSQSAKCTGAFLPERSRVQYLAWFMICLDFYLAKSLILSP